jgi:ATP-dependent Clp protease protease subunit
MALRPDPPRNRPPTAEEKERWSAEARLFDAQAEQAKTETRLFSAQARSAVANAKTHEILADREAYKRRIELETDPYHRVFRFLSAVNDSSAKQAIDELTLWSRLSPGQPMTIILYSPGGEVVAGMALMDFLTELRAAGHHLTIVARGMAASMAGVLLQAADVRVMGAEAWLLIHEGSFGAVGSVGEVEDRVIWVQKIQARIIDLFMSRIAQADEKTATKRLTRTQLKTKMHRTDWWISSDEALKFGLIDEIR